ncbi:DUF4260 domain-containing protein [Cochleicola gelatinilyticus]|uniref:DUF4260 domain-containing protein n=1 Tax=Cochleicola gelatinilyticus TaxID=1763537 RepID=A0A167IQN3_9FLAO|nr:DUF4260 domain-containing protein [Cochleicola gelatinilyticus]OAB79914.1 hypothetical protein ULVI_04020 [Cochleicola gelatinilyticus]
MNRILKIEEFAQFVLGIALFSQLSYVWWWFPALLLVPDIGMLGYLINPRLGAITYNVFHHKGIAIGILLAGMFLFGDLCTLIGVILFSHSAMDRMFGYGLKYPDSFQNTHLGTIGKK